MTTMTHDGYVATIELDKEAGLFHGEVINTRDVLTFQGRTLDELKIAFADTIADYIDWCRERGKEPQRPYSGNFTVRISRAASAGCHRRCPQRHEHQHIRRRDAGAVGIGSRETAVSKVSQSCQPALRSPSSMWA
jgi:predicted HicB family RNase H-like nuclease